MKPIQPKSRTERNLAIAVAVSSIIVAACELLVALKTPVKSPR